MNVILGFPSSAYIAIRQGENALHAGRRLMPLQGFEAVAKGTLECQHRRAFAGGARQCGLTAFDGVQLLDAIKNESDVTAAMVKAAGIVAE